MSKEIVKLGSEVETGAPIFADLPTLIESRLLVQANSGGGKSWAIRRLLEQSHGKVQQIVIDPEGEFGTLREKYDYILAGKGGDTPAEPRSAAMLARKLLEVGVSAIVDLYELPRQERRRFVRLFLEAIVDAPKELWHNVVIVIDEAHIFAPEKEQSEALNAVIDLASRGRKRGFCAVLATQRPAKLNKDAAAECNNKLIGRASLDIDRKRSAEELGFSSKDEILSLRKLKPGEWYAFGPAISEEVTKVKIGEVKTTHPKAGGRSVSRVTPPTAAIRKVLGKLADLPAEAAKEAQTVSELKGELAIARRELAQAKTGVKVDQRAIERAVALALEKQGKEHDKERIDWSVQLGTIHNVGRQLVEAGNKLLSVKVKDLKKTVSKPPVVSHTVTREYQPLREIKRVEPVQTDSEVKDIGSGERKVLSAIGQHAEGITKEHLTVLTGYKRTSRNEYLRRLQQRGLIEISGENVRITESGVEELGNDFEQLPTGPDLRERLMRTLPVGERKILGELLAAYPEALHRDVLSETTGYKSTSRNEYIRRLGARQLVTFEGSSVKASDKLFV